MKVEATVDVGQNLTSLLERLAQQIGTTADKVFPWYVQQAYLEGVTNLVVIAFFLVVSGAGLKLSFRHADFTDAGFNRYSFLSLVFGAMAFFWSLGLVIEGADSMRKILNPNYYAMGAITRDIGRLTAR